MKQPIEYPKLPPKSFEQWLAAAGWKNGHGHYRTCPVCHRSAEGDYYFGWDSPGYRFYHKECLMKAPQVQRLYRQYLKAQSRQP